MNLYRIDTIPKMRRNPAKDLGMFYCHEFEVLRETAKGYWITGKEYGFSSRWVSKTSRKAFAHDTMEKAENYFYFRKRKHLQILKRQAEVVSEALKMFRRSKEGAEEWEKIFTSDHKTKQLLGEILPI